jgi:hypothetical protein
VTLESGALYPVIFRPAKQLFLLFADFQLLLSLTVEDKRIFQVFGVR